MEERSCDLHTHSTFSDGTCTPEEIVEAAKSIGLGAVALTDHNTTKGLPAFMDAGRAAGVRTIAGCELSTTYNRHEVHIVALFIPEERYDDVQDYTRQLWEAKNKSNIALARALTEAGYPVNYEAMLAASAGGQINRSGFGDEIERLGYMTKREAFDTVLRPRRQGGLYRVPKRPETLDTIAFVRSIGALPVLAHAFLNFKETEELETFLAEGKERGLAAMEVYYSTFDAEQQKEAARLAARFGLLESGGSDFHGRAKPRIALGTGRGTVAVPCSAADRLEAAAKEVRISD